MVPTKARLTYFQEKSLKVELQYLAVDEWTSCFETGPVKIPSVAYLGFSAETGELHDNHDIISVETWNMHVRESNDRAKVEAGKPSKKSKAYNPVGEQESQGWGWFFIKIVLFLVVVAGAYVGFTVYRTSQRSSRF